jgi:hypothetical protein
MKYLQRGSARAVGCRTNSAPAVGSDGTTVKNSDRRVESANRIPKCRRAEKVCGDPDTNEITNETKMPWMGMPPRLTTT